MDTKPIAHWRWNEHWHRSIPEAISELEREAQVRLRCYDRWINEGKVSRVDAWDRLERLLSAINHLRHLETALANESEQATLNTAQEEPERTVVPLPATEQHRVRKIGA